MKTSIQLAGELVAGSVRAARQAANHILGRQHTEGFWWADLTADTTLESDYLLLLLWLHPPREGVWNPPNHTQVNRAVASILARQLPDGGFNTYPTGPADVSASVKAYFALKLAGLAVDDPRMVKLRETILRLGGIQAANSYVRLNLSLFDLFPRQYVPNVPPEMILLPGGPIYQMSSWSRAIVIPLAVIHALDPRRPVPAGFNLDELFLRGAKPRLAVGGRHRGWSKVFLVADRFLKWWERWGSRSLRLKAMRECENWILAHTSKTDGLAAIYPPMMYTIMALDLLGYAPDHPVRVEAQRQFDRLMVDDGKHLFFQPCFSPVWDTAIVGFALAMSGAAPPQALTRMADWLLTKEVREKGDWSVKRPKTEPSGWYFEFANEFYPDIDDTAMVLLALRHASASNPDAQQACVGRAVRWLLDMQSQDGGWAAFDVDNNWYPLSFVPFADHNAMLDPTCPDITGRVIEALCAWGVEGNSPAIRRAVQYLLRTQERNGSWYGRWGVDYVYGTFLALRGLRAAGVGPNHPGNHPRRRLAPARPKPRRRVG